MSPNDGLDNPHVVSEWRTMVEREPEISQTPDKLALGHLVSWQSGSSLTMPEYLHLRVLWKPHKSDIFRLESFVEDNAIEKASTLAKTGLCTNFCKNAMKRTPLTEPHDEKSMFSLVKFYVDLVRGLDKYAINNNVEKVFVGRVSRSHTS